VRLSPPYRPTTAVALGRAFSKLMVVESPSLLEALPVHCNRYTAAAALVPASFPENTFPLKLPATCRTVPMSKQSLKTPKPGGGGGLSLTLHRSPLALLS